MSKPVQRASLAVALVLLAGCSRSGIFNYLAAEELVQVTPPTAGAELNQTVSFKATVTPPVAGSTFNWSLSPAVGTIDANGTYTAPSVFPSDVSGTTLKITITASLTGTLSTPGTAQLTLTSESVGPAVALVKVSGDNQTVVVGTAYGAPIVVEAVDAHQVPVSGLALHLTPSWGDQVLSGTTGSDGQASFSVTAGDASGAETLTASAVGSDLVPPVVFKATATPGPLEQLVATDALTTGIADATLATPLSLEFEDKYGNPIAGRSATVATPGGALATPLTAQSAATGIQQFTIQLGPAIGPQVFTFADSQQPSVSTTFTFNVVPAGPAALLLISGGSQSGAVGTQLADPIVFEVVDANAQPVTGASVSLTTTPLAADGGGTLSATAPTTDAQGLVSVTFTLGTLAGVEQIVANAGNIVGSPLTVTETAIPTVASLVPISGNGQTAAPSTQLPEPLVVEALDGNGQPIPGAIVAFEAPVGGSVDNATVTTDANGDASVTATLSGTIGTQSFTATSGAASATFVETAGMVVPSLELEIVSGNNQSATVGTALSAPLVVEVIDTTTMAPVAGVAVAWTSANGGTVTGQAQTGANGQATATVTLETAAGPEQIVADAGAIANSPVTFVATATAGPVAALTLVTGDGQTTTVGAPFGIAFGVEATDSFGNPVTGATVDFATTSGSGTASPANVQTDAAGLAQAELTAGGAPETEQYTASIPGTMLSVTVTETVTGTGTLHIAIVSGNNQSGAAGTALPQPLEVVVTQGGTPVSGQTVTFGVESGNGTVSSATVSTDMNGDGSTTATLGSLAGAQTFSASIVGSDGSSPVFFTETASGGVVVSLVVISGNGQTSNPGDALAQPLVVEALDANGQPVVGATITFTPPMGGAVSLTTVTTNGQGEAQVTGTLGPVAGPQTFTATSGSATATFTENASAVTTGLILTIVSGSGQSAAAGSPLGQPLVVQVTNQGGGAVSGTTITWTAPSGASITPASGPTDGSGDAQAAATLGPRSGSQTFTASCSGCTNSPVSFTETANAGPPSQIVIVSGDGQSGAAGAALASPLVVEVEDASGNPVPGVTITFTVGVGGGSIAPPASGPSDANGQLSVQATLGGLPGTDTFTATASVGSVTFTETATAQITGLSLTPQDAHLDVGAAQQYTATATYADGTKGDVTAESAWSTSNGGVATIGATSGLLSATGAGTATVTATCSGFTASTPVVVASATLTSIVLTPVNPTIGEGGTLQFNAEGQYSNNTISDVTASCSWTSSNGSVATIGTAGLATGAAQGQTTIECSVMGVNATQTLTVTSSPITSLQITPTYATGYVGSGASFTATATFQNGTVENVTTEAQWSSSSTTLMTVQNAPAQAGFATYLATGTPNVIATYEGLTAQVTVTITTATVVSLVVTPATTSIVEQETGQLQAQATWSDGTVTTVTDLAVWTTSSAGIADVSNASGTSGLVTGVGAGTATITATFGGQSASATVNVSAASAQVLRVYVSTPSLEQNATQVTCDEGQTTDLQAGAVLFGGGGGLGGLQIQVLTTQAAWTTSNPTVAIVGNGATGGEVQCLTAGTATITASFEGQSDSASVTVDAVTLTGITLAPPSATIPLGTFQALHATGTYSDGSQQDITAVATWSSQSTATATVSNASGTQGQVTGVGMGMTTVTCSYEGQSATAAITVTAATLTNVIVTPADPSFMYNPNGGGGGGIFGGGGRTNPNTLDFSATAIFSDNTTASVTAEATWTSSDPNVAVVTTTIATEGIVVDIESTGTSQISATYSGVTGQTTLTSY